MLAASFEFILQALSVTDSELRRDPMEVLTIGATRFSGSWCSDRCSRARAIPTDALRYLDFMVPGVLAQSVLFTAIVYGIAII